MLFAFLNLFNMDDEKWVLIRTASAEEILSLSTP